jgi:UDP-N-acetylmuramate: L-alanyl-gamma-D-glutamyl-meso-diaminopimelate ligase
VSTEPASRHLHFLGICGYAVSGAALLARELGYRVTGSDDNAYPPTTDILTAAGVEWVDGSDPANLRRWGTPDEVVVGNQTRPGNAEWLAAQELGLPIRSEIEFYAAIAKDRRRAAICGTHGKTTTTALLASILSVAGQDPGLRLGSVSLDLGVSARLGSGPFVFEGDEYSSAPWDPRPKFLHMAPSVAAITRLELDHPDIYPDLDAYRAPFVELVTTMPADGLLVLCGDDENVAALASRARPRVVTYGTARADCVVSAHGDDGITQSVTLSGAVETDLQLTFPGVHNALNAAAAILVARELGADLESCRRACATFRGPARRFQILGTFGGVTVVDDYAHHPTECAASLAAARRRWPDRRVIAVHTPHTYSRTRALLADYADVFADADELILGPIEAARERGQEATVSSRDVRDVVSAPQAAVVVDDAGEAIAKIVSESRRDDVVVVLSLGGFDKIASRLAAALEAGDGG